MRGTRSKRLMRGAHPRSTDKEPIRGEPGVRRRAGLRGGAAVTQDGGGMRAAVTAKSTDFRPIRGAYPRSVSSRFRGACPRRIFNGLVQGLSWKILWISPWDPGLIQGADPRSASQGRRGVWSRVGCAVAAARADATAGFRFDHYGMEGRDHGRARRRRGHERDRPMEDVTSQWRT